MADVTAAIAATRTAVTEFLATAECCGPSWTTAPAPGKWSPSQVTEHVARALEQSAKVVAGEPSAFPTIPAFVRPLLRGAFYNRVLKKGAFFRAKTSKPFNPAAGPATPAEGRVRLETARGKFEDAAGARAAQGSAVSSTLFGTVSLASYVRFQELHIRHHAKQLLTRPTE